MDTLKDKKNKWKKLDYLDIEDNNCDKLIELQKKTYKEQKK